MRMVRSDFMLLFCLLYMYVLSWLLSCTQKFLREALPAMLVKTAKASADFVQLTNGFMSSRTKCDTYISYYCVHSVSFNIMSFLTKITLFVVGDTIQAKTY